VQAALMPSHLDVFQKPQWKRAYCDTLANFHTIQRGGFALSMRDVDGPHSFGHLVFCSKMWDHGGTLACLFLHFAGRRSPGGGLFRRVGPNAFILSSLLKWQITGLV
jgi:hypothetical protein